MNRRALLLNDCRVSDHWGTRLVYDGLAGLCREVGIEIVRTYPVGFDRWDREFVNGLRDIDLVLANGEGTLHHDAPAAGSLIEGAGICRRNGRSVVLMNAVWQSNSALLSGLRHFARIFVRESLSALEVRSAGFSAEVIPDLSLAASLCGGGEAFGTGPPFVTDSVIPEIGMRLARLARKSRYSFRPMRDWLGRWAVRHPIEAVRSLLANRQGSRPLGPSDLSGLQEAPFLLTGRFHGACLAISLGVPFLVLESNSHKSKGLCLDLGRRDLWFGNDMWPQFESRVREWEVGSAELLSVRAEIETYRTRAMDGFRYMMKEIVALP